MSDVAVDTSEAVELAPRVWWVGSMLPHDRFQCHVYLVEQGDQSVLIDPGSALITDEVIRKVDSIVGLANVRWLVCSHADPDIIGALPALVAKGLHPEAAIVTYWRDAALIVHSGTQLPFWLIEDHDWRLALEDRTLQFIFTPYLHFAGAFCTFDETSGTLFSSDLFGGFTDDHSLFASSMAYFEAIRAFHEHYMPSREILAHAMQELRNLPMKQIAPQHGQVVPLNLIAPIMEKLERLECGIYLLARNDPGLAFLLDANRTIHDVVDTLVREQQFSAVAEHLAELSAQLLDTEYLELWAGAGSILLHFDQSDGYAGYLDDPPDDVQRILAGVVVEPGRRLLLPIISLASDRVNGVVVLGFSEPALLDQPTLAVVSQIIGLVEVGLEREVLTRSTDLERAAWHAQAIHDPLTGLFNRVSLTDAFSQLLAYDDRKGSPQMAALMIDIDHFKMVNDTFGHPVGDQVLQNVATSITASIRPTDLAFRYGGEEFLVLLDDVVTATAVMAAERIRERVARSLEYLPRVTASVGVALRRHGEGHADLTQRADEALYAAKDGGRDRVSVAE